MKGINKVKNMTKNFTDSFRLSYRQMRRSDGNIITFIVYGMLYDLFLNLYKPFSVKFLDRLGGEPFHITLLNSLPGILAVLALIPGSLLLSRFRHKKKILAVFFAISRTFVLALAFVPFFPAALRPIFFVVLISAMNFPDAVSQSGLQSFLGDVFDGRARSQAITLRNKFGQVIAPVVTFTTGLIVTVVPKTEEQAIIVYQIFFILAFIVGIIEVLMFLRFKEKDGEREAARKAPAQENPGIRDVAATLVNKKFVAYLLPTLFFYFTYQAGWPLFSILSVRDLGATELQLALVTVGSGTAGFFSAGFWSKRIIRKGNDIMTIFAVMNLALLVFLTALSPNIYFYMAVQTFGGFIGIGIVITLLNGLLTATPEKNRVIYIAVYNTFINISLGVSPYVSNVLYNALGTRAAMFVVAGGRLSSGLVLLGIYLKHRHKENKKS